MLMLIKQVGELRTLFEIRKVLWLMKKHCYHPWAARVQHEL